MRVLFALMCWVAMLLLSLIFTSIASFPVLVAFGIWMVLLAATFNLFVVSVPEVTGLVVLNALTGKMKSFGSGLHIKFPWDKVRKENFFSLEIRTEEFQETYAAKDGPMMLVKASFQYNPDPHGLDKFIAVDLSTIKKGFIDVVSSDLSGIIGAEDAEICRQNVDRIEKDVLDKLNDRSLSIRGTLISMKEKIESQYGINIRLVNVADIDFDEDYQKARAGVARMGKFASAAKGLKSDFPSLTDREAVNTTLLEQGKGTSKQIIDLEGADGIANLIARFFLGKGGSK